MSEKTRRKLLINEKVEVRSGEDGFLGSWNSGRVIGYDNLVRVVLYDHFLNDEGSSNLIERVKVSPAVDGVVPSKGGYVDDYRGFIRPLPPSNALGLSVVHYGQCVDMFYDDAWWEGVILDHEDGCDQRRIFFPDMGDEMEAKIGLLRSSRDWDEVTEEWKPRPNWLFLEMIEELKQDCLLPVSLKQIWYEVRMKDDFEKLSGWTCSVRHMWRELVMQVLFDNLRITVRHFFMELNSSWNSSDLGRPFVQLSDQVFDDVLKNEGPFRSSLVDVPFEATSQLDGKEILSSDQYESNAQVHERRDLLPTTSCVSEQARSLSLPTFQDLFHNPDEGSIVGSKSCNQAAERNFQLGHVECTTQKIRVQWQSVVPQLISGAEFCPDDMDECVKMTKSNKRPSNTAILNARKHLLYLNWKVQFMEDLRIRRFRYFSPDGELFYSFRQLCLKFDCESQDLGPGSQMSLTDGRNVSMSLVEEMPSIGGNSQCSTELSKLCNPSDMQLLVRPEYCPEAIVSYYSICLDKRSVVPSHEIKMKALKAKRHLSSSGWSLYYHVRGNKRVIRYSSPNGAVFYSLYSACKWCIESGTLTFNELYPTAERIGNVNVIGDFNDHTAISESHRPLLTVGSVESLSLENGNSENLPDESSNVSMMDGLVRSSEDEVCKARILRKRGKRCIEGSVLPGGGRKPRALMEIVEDMHTCSSTPVRRSSKRVGDMIGCSSTPVRRSSKRVRDMISCSSTPVRRSSKRVRSMIASCTQKNPRTVLSWLIDNNVVLPRSKVRYLGRSNGMVMKEGRIAREGIKCSCCGETYSISKFSAHAGSTNYRPSANIFLEDGRCLLECQLQLKERKNRGFQRSESHERKGSRRKKTNDCICSICHYGGELLLCDQCPSAFHIHCLGLKISCDCFNAAVQGVPDGDWFCPSCCCQICRQGSRKNGQAADSPVLICDQCEHQYHVECLIVKGIVNIDYRPKGYWFCQDTCKQIFYGLRKILGKPIPVGTDNLTWTLVKYIKSDSYDLNSCDDKGVLDNYSKLNVALSVMHECFEPVRDPSTRRDLVEDVIFSRWSELHRLNFQGFYTVLLEKNDELISAATVRIYGKRVAEVPLVATRFQYRRVGMCRVLMNALERKLAELGVERLVLPAVPSVLNTWTTSFGFSLMSAPDRLNFLDNIFLDFQGTVTCQKILACNPSLTSSPSTRTQVTSCYQVNENLNIELDGSSTVSEVFQVDQVTMPDISDHGSMGIATGATGADNENGELATVVKVDQSTTPTCLPFPTTISLDCPATIADGKESEDTGAGLLKCYRRRRISAC